MVGKAATIDRLANIRSLYLHARHRKGCALAKGLRNYCNVQHSQGCLTFIHTSPTTTQLYDSSVVKSELTASRASQVPAESQGPGAVVRDTLATSATILNSKSRNVVVTSVKRTRKIVETTNGTSKERTLDQFRSKRTDLQREFRGRRRQFAGRILDVGAPECLGIYRRDS